MQSDIFWLSIIIFVYFWQISDKFIYEMLSKYAKYIFCNVILVNFCFIYSTDYAMIFIFLLYMNILLFNMRFLFYKIIHFFSLNYVSFLIFLKRSLFFLAFTLPEFVNLELILFLFTIFFFLVSKTLFVSITDIFILFCNILIFYCNNPAYFYIFDALNYSNKQ